MISVGGELKNSPQRRPVKNMSIDPVLCAAMFQPCPVVFAIHAVLIHLSKNNLGKDASQGLSDAGELRWERLQA